MIYRKLKANYFGNLSVSLFWEEKLVLLIKMIQFAGFVLIVFNKYWPATFHEELSSFFYFFTFSFFLMGGEQ